MTNRLNEENYETVFFKLLENEYDQTERQAILKEIENNSFYSFEWDCWQKAMLQDESEKYAEAHESFFENIKAEALVVAQPERKRVIPMFRIISAIAASLIIGIAVVMNVDRTKHTQNGVVVVSNDTLKNEPVQQQEIKAAEEKMAQSHETEETETLEEIKNWIPKEVYVEVQNILIDTFSVDTLIRSEQPIAVSPKPFPTIKPDSTPRIEIVQAKVKPYTRKFSVSNTSVEATDIVYTVRDIEEQNIKLLDLVADKHITFVRQNDKLYLKLDGNNENPIYIALSF
ncbi:MAG: hypothetical protein H6607_08970 [Flavobacteriales bacterium]|nr:hypothetical protein [Flavobacteriales bacterium]